MQLSRQHAEDFIEAWEKDSWETLTFEEAESEAKRLLDFCAAMQEMRPGSLKSGPVGVPF